MSGCGGKSTTGTGSRSYFGITRVSFPASISNRTNMLVREVRNYGVAYGTGSLGIGYNFCKEISLPAESGLYVEVESSEQFESLRKLIEQNPNYPICIIQKQPGVRPAEQSGKLPPP